MKRILMLLMTIFAITATQAQQKVTLKQCQGDTVAYLKKNFEEGKARFIGKPFSKVVDEWRSQMPIKWILLFGTDHWARNEKERDLINGVSLYYMTEGEKNMKSMCHESQYSLHITFTPPYNQKKMYVYDLQDEEGSILGPKVYNSLKDYIVQDISVYETKL